MKHNNFSELAQLRVFTRNVANQREVGFQDDVGVRMRRLRGRFGADERPVAAGYG
jgi:hypothetical protein